MAFAGTSYKNTKYTKPTIQHSFMRLKSHIVPETTLKKNLFFNKLSYIHTMIGMYVQEIQTIGEVCN